MNNRANYNKNNGFYGSPEEAVRKKYFHCLHNIQHAGHSYSAQGMGREKLYEARSVPKIKKAAARGRTTGGVMAFEDHVDMVQRGRWLVAATGFSAALWVMIVSGVVRFMVI